MRISFVFLFLFFFLFISSAFGVGLGITPGKLEFNILSENDFEQEIYVINTEDQEFDFSLYSDSDILSAYPSEFSLKAGKNKKVVVKLDAKKIEEDFKATLFIVSSEPGNQNVRAGVKMPITVKVLNKSILKKAVEKIATEQKEKEGSEEKSVFEEMPVVGLFSLASYPAFWAILLIALLTVITFILIRKKRKH